MIILRLRIRKRLILIIWVLNRFSLLSLLIKYLKLSNREVSLNLSFHPEFYPLRAEIIKEVPELDHTSLARLLHMWRFLNCRLKSCKQDGSRNSQRLYWRSKPILKLISAKSLIKQIYRIKHPNKKQKVTEVKSIFHLILRALRKLNSKKKRLWKIKKHKTPQMLKNLMLIIRTELITFPTQ